MPSLESLSLFFIATLALNLTPVRTCSTSPRVRPLRARRRA